MAHIHQAVLKEACSTKRSGSCADLVLLLYSSKCPPEHAHPVQPSLLHTLYCMLLQTVGGNHMFPPVVKCSSRASVTDAQDGIGHGLLHMCMMHYSVVPGFPHLLSQSSVCSPVPQQDLWTPSDRTVLCLHYVESALLGDAAQMGEHSSTQALGGLMVPPTTQTNLVNHAGPAGN